MEAKRTTKTDVKIKDIRIIDGEVQEFESGKVVNLLSMLTEVYGDECFTLTCTTKSEEIIEIEDE